MDFYDFPSNWIMQIIQNCISDMAVWRSFTDAIIFYLNIGDLGLHFCGFNCLCLVHLLWNFYPYFFTIISLQTIPVFALLCFAITIVTLQNLHLDLFSLSLSSLLNPNFYKKRLKSVAKITPNTKVM
ncbi:hypothetical protein AMTRI_Chr12g236140 [Amborella trichopoda]